jgi:hypothetical protein
MRVDISRNVTKNVWKYDLIATEKKQLQEFLKSSSEAEEWLKSNVPLVIDLTDDNGNGKKTYCLQFGLGTYPYYIMVSINVRGYLEKKEYSWTIESQDGSLPGWLSAVIGRVFIGLI